MSSQIDEVDVLEACTIEGYWRQNPLPERDHMGYLIELAYVGMSASVEVCSVDNDTPELTNWYSARCRGVNPELFIPEKGNNAKSDAAAAKAICEVCPIRLACLELGLRISSPAVMGGLTERERRPIKRERLKIK